MFAPNQRSGQLIQSKDETVNHNQGMKWMTSLRTDGRMLKWVADTTYFLTSQVCLIVCVFCICVLVLREKYILN